MLVLHEFKAGRVRGISDEWCSEILTRMPQSQTMSIGTRLRTQQIDN
jgi:hypothetical protein